MGIREVSGVVDGCRSTTDHDLAQEGVLSDTSVLDLNVTEAVNTFLDAVSREYVKGIEGSKRRLRTELVLEIMELGGGLAALGRGESGGRAVSWRIWLVNLRNIILSIAHNIKPHGTNFVKLTDLFLLFLQGSYLSRSLYTHFYVEKDQVSNFRYDWHRFPANIGAICRDG